LSRPVAGRRPAVLFHPTKTWSYDGTTTVHWPPAPTGWVKCTAITLILNWKGQELTASFRQRFRCRHFAMGSRRLAPRQGWDRCGARIGRPGAGTRHRRRDQQRLRPL